MKTLNKVKISIWINALKCYCDWYFIFNQSSRIILKSITIIAGIIITATGIIDFIYYLNGWLRYLFYEEYVIKWFFEMYLRNICFNPYTTYDNIFLIYL